MFRLFIPDFLPIIIFMISIIFVSEMIIYFFRKKNNISLGRYMVRSFFTGYHRWINWALFILYINAVFIFLYTSNTVGAFFVTLGGSLIYSLIDIIIEYKYNKSEKVYIVRAISSISIAVVLVGVILLQPPIITFAKFVDESGANGFEEIREVDVIRAGNPSKDVSLKDEKVIDQLFDKLSNIKMRRTLNKTNYADPFYNLNLNYESAWKDNLIFDIEVHKNFLVFNSNNQYYKVVGSNDIYELLEQYELD